MSLTVSLSLWFLEIFSCVFFWMASESMVLLEILDEVFSSQVIRDEIEPANFSV